MSEATACDIGQTSEYGAVVCHDIAPGIVAAAQLDTAGTTRVDVDRSVQLMFAS
jgi:hypothetical protein